MHKLIGHTNGTERTTFQSRRLSHKSSISTECWSSSSRKPVPVISQGSSSGNRVPVPHSEHHRKPLTHVFTAEALDLVLRSAVELMSSSAIELVSEPRPRMASVQRKRTVDSLVLELSERRSHAARDRHSGRFLNWKGSNARNHGL